MSERAASPIAERKQPRQARSNDLVAAVLDAAVQVLLAEGAHRFTTARVAERAGVSVGSLYQYFPNKAAILFRLQADEWRRTTAMLVDIVEDRSVPPVERLRRMVRAFIRSECEEAAVRAALDDAAPFYRDAPEARQARVRGTRAMTAFVAELLPRASGQRRAVVDDLIGSTVNAVGKRFSETPRTEAEIDAYANEVGDMLCAYVERCSDDRVPLSPTSSGTATDRDRRATISTVSASSIRASPLPIDAPPRC